jgi:hypothetical protein
MLMADYILELTKEKVVTSFEIKEDNIFVHNNEFVKPALLKIWLRPAHLFSDKVSSKIRKQIPK